MGVTTASGALSLRLLRDGQTYPLPCSGSRRVSQAVIPAWGSTR